eukprot:7388715-Prymnesium_polylepis.3
MTLPTNQLTGWSLLALPSKRLLHQIQLHARPQASTMTQKKAFGLRPPRRPSANGEVQAVTRRHHMAESTTVVVTIIAVSSTPPVAALSMVSSTSWPRRHTLNNAANANAPRVRGSSR